MSAATEKAKTRNPDVGQRVDEFRATLAVSSPADRAASKTFKLAPSFPCGSCKRFAFPGPRMLCFWCRK